MAVMSASGVVVMILAAGLTGGLSAAPAAADETPARVDESASAITVSRTARGLSVEVRDASLRQVLERLAALEKLDLDIRGTSDPRVTATIRDASLAEALQRLLRYDFVLGVDRLIVYLGDRGQRERLEGPAPRGGFRPPMRPPRPEPEPEPEPEDE